MEYSEINYRVQQIKMQIFEFRERTDTDLTSKIETLKIINNLLREQNRLIGLKITQSYNSLAA